MKWHELPDGGLIAFMMHASSDAPVCIGLYINRHDRVMNRGKRLTALKRSKLIQAKRSLAYHLKECD